MKDTRDIASSDTEGLLSKQLPGRLARECARTGRSIALMIEVNGSARLFRYPEGGDGHAHQTVPVGCVAKSLTATLVAIAVADGLLRFDDPVGTLLGLNGAHALQSIAIHHLLTHTHGLDESAVRTSLDSSGFIEVKPTDELPTREYGSSPGTLFNYGNTGFRIAAAILERIYGSPYRSVLNQQLLAPMGMAHGRAEGPVCPAMGDGIELSLEDISRVVRLHNCPDRVSPHWKAAIASLRHCHVHTLWSGHPFADRVCMGWYDHGGSYGQTGRGDAGSVAVRFSPEHDWSAVLTTDDPQAAPMMLAALVGDLLPGLASRRMPRLQVRSSESRIPVEAYEGVFVAADWTVTVNAVAGEGLRISCARRPQSGSQAEEIRVKRRLLAAEGNVFLPAPPEPTVVPVVSFSGQDGSGRFRYLHTPINAFVRRTHAVAADPSAMSRRMA